MVRCMACGVFNPEDAKFCIKCGVEIVKENPGINIEQTLKSEANKTYCPKCGVKNPDDAKFCTKCGFSLPKMDKVPPPQKKSPDRQIPNTRKYQKRQPPKRPEQKPSPVIGASPTKKVSQNTESNYRPASTNESEPSPDIATPEIKAETPKISIKQVPKVKVSPNPPEKAETKDSNITPAVPEIKQVDLSNNKPAKSIDNKQTTVTKPNITDKNVALENQATGKPLNEESKITYCDVCGYAITDGVDVCIMCGKSFIEEKKITVGDILEEGVVVLELNLECPRCHVKNLSDSQFCRICGAKIKN